MKIKNVRVSTTVSLIVVACVLFVIAIFFLAFIKADQLNSAVFKGKVFESLDAVNYSLESAIYGKVAIGVTVTLVDCSDKSYSATTDSSGNYSISVPSPNSCSYAVYLSGGKYNAKRAADVHLKSPTGTAVISTLLTNGGSVQNNYFVDRETDLMYSLYNWGAYAAGYQGFYHLSKNDVHYLRNYISLSQVQNKQIPSTATFTVPIKLGNSWIISGGTSAVPKADVYFDVYAVSENWSGAKQIASSGKSLQTIKLPLESVIKTTSLKFDPDLSGLSDDAKYQSWINGFAVKTRIVPLIPGRGDLNPDILVPRSEDRSYNVVSPITYSGLKSFPATFVCACQDLIRTNIRTTQFGGCGKDGKCADNGDPCYAGGSHISTGCDGPTQYFASLPYGAVAQQCNGDINKCMRIKVTNPANGKSVILAVVDSGPCNTVDKSYICGPDRPSVESGINVGGCSPQKSNPAGLDISPTAMTYLGGDPKIIDRFNWQFVSGTTVGPVR